MNNKEYFMKLALKEAEKAYKKNEVPVGVIIVKNNKIIARAYNKKEKNKNSISHAEIIAIKKASKKITNWRLNECEMYITLEPCCMCTGAIINSRIKKIYVGTEEPKTGACGSIVNLLEIYKNESKVEIEFGICKNECSDILKKFFKMRRIQNKCKGKING